jgi:hypothetical protein
MTFSKLLLFWDYDVLPDDTALEILCQNLPNLTTTNIAVPDSLFQNSDYVKITFLNTGISQIINPLLSKQFSDVKFYLTISGWIFMLK